MSDQMPALSLAAVPGRRKTTLELAAEIERRGFTGIYCPSMFDGLDPVARAMQYHYIQDNCIVLHL